MSEKKINKYMLAQLSISVYGIKLWNPYEWNVTNSTILKTRLNY